MRGRSRDATDLIARKSAHVPELTRQYRVGRLAFVYAMLLNALYDFTYEVQIDGRHRALRTGERYSEYINFINKGVWTRIDILKKFLKIM